MKRLIAIILLLSLLTVPASATVSNFAGGTYYGLSSDTKPNSSEGSRFWESDTKKWYLRQSGNWVDWTPTGGGTPSDTVTTETDFGQSSTPGTSSEYSRGNHSHGTPADSTPAHSSLTTGIHGVSSGDVASTSDISTHASGTLNVHNADADGNSPAQAHGNERHSTAYGSESVLNTHTSNTVVHVTADDHETIAGTIAMGNTGCISGGDVLCSLFTCTVTAGTGWITLEGEPKIKYVTWPETVVNMSSHSNTFGYFFVDYAGDVLFDDTEEPAYGENILLAVGNTDDTCVNFLADHRMPADSFQPRIDEYLENVIGPLCESGIIASVYSAPSRSIVVSSGRYFSRHDSNDIIGSNPAGTPITFNSFYWNDSGMPVEYAENINTIDNTHYVNTSHAIVTMTTGSFRRDLLSVTKTPTGEQFITIFGDVQYATKAAAEAGANPIHAGSIHKYAMHVAALIVEGGGNIVSVIDQRPFNGQFLASGGGVSGGMGDVTGPGIAVSDNFAAFNGTTGKIIKDSGSNASTFAVAAAGVTNGNSHDHAGGDGAQIAYGTLSGIPSTFAPTSHGNAAHTSTFITAADLPTLYNQTIQDEGTARTQRAAINFVGSGVSCVDDTNRTTCTINGGSGSFSITQIEVDMGWPAVRDKTFTITDAGVSAGMSIITSIAYEDNSTSANSADEATVSEIRCAAGKAGTGTYTLFCSAPLPVGGKFKLNITKA